MDVNSCGHILREGRRRPCPDKLLPLKEWQIPQIITALRLFSGSVNYVSEYIHSYASFAAPMEKLRRKNEGERRRRNKEGIDSAG